MSLNTHLGAAHLDIQSGRPAEALTKLSALQKSYPKNADVWRLSAMAARKSGNPAQAEDWLGQALALDGGNCETWNALGLSQDDQGRVDAALDSFQKALDLRPDFAPAAINAGRLLNRLSRHEETLRVLEPFERDAKARLLQAQAVQALEGPERAIGIYRALSQADPTNPQAHYGQCLCLLEMGASEQALPGLAALSKSGFAPAHYPLFTALARLKRYEEAFKAVQQALIANPFDEKALHGGAQLLYMTGRAEQIQPYFENLVEATNGAAMVVAVYLDVLIQMETFDKARALAERATKFHGQTDWLINRRLSIEIEAQEASAAQSIASSLPAELHSDPRLRGNLVRAYLMNGAFEQSGPLIEEGVAALEGDRFWRALEAVQARGVGDMARYRELVDLDAFTMTTALTPPSQYADIAEFNASLAAVLRQLHDFSAPPLDQSLRAGTQTPTDLRHSQEPVIREFFAMVEAAFRRYRDQLTAKPGHPLLGAIPDAFELVGAWSVRLGPGGRHVNHVHPEGWLSSVYYVDVPPQVQGAPDKEGWLKFCEPPFPVPGQDAERHVQPRAGELTLFPSYFWHGTEPIRSGERLTIAFDIAPKRG
ncbi:tetratricopeptide repeat protein [Oceanicaulis sp. MMSF_3324]|uniref:tetratricopeptide repeat protein n=1 Tax=Oceanicaulis sp. MMSF_3324 TaxID=3046702 RepID=UPI00273EC3E0|nr:tetratricopeptide repeat protein [Oceanicaulis sp. MMSF_3324]